MRPSPNGEAMLFRRVRSDHCSSPTGRRRGRVRHFGTVVIVLVHSVANNAHAASALNAQSPLGLNLARVTYYSSEQPFLNIFKMGGGWITHGGSTWDTDEERYLNLDSNGYPITLIAVNDPNPQRFTSVGVLLERDLPDTANGYYPAGQYAVDYDGQGTLTYQFDASLISSSAGRDVINVMPSRSGIFIQITGTDPHHTGNYVRNIRVVRLQNEAALNAGQVFNPMFLTQLQNFHALRFIDWFNTNGSTLSSWSNRPLPSFAFWGGPLGVPIEVAVQLANAISADAWLNAPIMADNDYFTQMAKTVNNLLGKSQRAYVELSNEVWNGSFSQNAYSRSQGQASFPRAPNQHYAGWEWYGMRVAQMGDIWYGIYGSSFAFRVTIVMAGQAANPAILQAELATPDWTGTGNAPATRHHIGAAGIAPYFLYTPDPATVATWLSQSDGGLTALFAMAAEAIAASNYQTSSTVAALATYGLPIVAYEGGQSLEGSPNYRADSAAVKLFTAANRDARMATVYTAYLKGWKASGGTLFMHYNSAGAYHQYGAWGALESVMQTTRPLASSPAKWQALQNFITSSPCWWSGCNGNRQ
jgi:hypothetical protein